MKDNKTDWLETFGLREDDESIALILVALVALFLGFFWLRGFGDDAATTQIASDTGEAVVVDAGSPTLEGRYLNTGTLNLEGTGTPNTTLDIYMNDRQIGSADIDTFGKWTFSSRVRDSGDHVVYARTQDAISSKALDSDAFAFSALVGGAIASTVDEENADSASEDNMTAPEVEESAETAAVPPPPRATAEPAAPIAPTINPAVQGANIEFNPQGATTIDGTGEPNSAVNLFIDDIAFDSAETDDSGNWQLVLPFGAFKVGQHILKAGRGDNADYVSESATVFVNSPMPSSFQPGTDGIEQDAGLYKIKGLGHPNWQVAVGPAGGPWQNVGTTDTGAWAFNNYDFTTPGVYILEIWSVDTNGAPLTLDQSATVTMRDPNAAAVVPAVEPVTEEEPTAEPATALPAADVIDLMAQDGRFTTLLTAINSFGLTEQFRTQGPFTIFAPTDAALAALPDGAMGDYLANGEELTKVLEAHVVSGQLLAGDVLANTVLTTVGGNTLIIDPANGTVNGTAIVETDKIASNGVVHVIDSLILPQDQFAPPVIDVVGVPTFVGPLLTIVGTAQPDTVLLIELNGEIFGFTFVEPDGTWLVSDNVDANAYEIIAYTYEKGDRGGLLRGISAPVNLIVE